MIVKFELNAFTLREVAESWGCTEREILQAAIDGRIRLCVYGPNDTLVQFDGEGNPVNTDSPLPFRVSGYRFVHQDDLARIDAEGSAEIDTFLGDDGGLEVYRTPLTVRREHLRITAAERQRFETEHARKDSPGNGSRDDQRIERILKEIADLGLNAHDIPANGTKARIGALLCEQRPEFFTPSTFEKAWNEASKAGLLSIRGKAKFRPR